MHSGVRAVLDPPIETTRPIPKLALSPLFISWFGIGDTMLVGAEMVATSDGVAWMALTAADFVQTDVVLVGVLIMAALGYGLDRLFRALERRVVHWAGKE